MRRQNSIRTSILSLCIFLIMGGTALHAYGKDIASVDEPQVRLYKVGTRQLIRLPQSGSPYLHKPPRSQNEFVAQQREEQGFPASSFVAASASQDLTQPFGAAPPLDLTRKADLPPISAPPQYIAPIRRHRTVISQPYQPFVGMGKNSSIRILKLSDLIFFLLKS